MRYLPWLLAAAAAVAAFVLWRRRPATPPAVAARPPPIVPAVAPNASLRPPPVRAQPPRFVEPSTGQPVSAPVVRAAAREELRAEARTFERRGDA